MGKVFNSMILGVLITLSLTLFNGSGIAPTSLILMLLNPVGWKNSTFWLSFSSLLTVTGFITIGLAAIIKQDWVVRAGIVTSLSSILIFPFVDLFRFFVTQSNYIDLGCVGAPICDHLSSIEGIGQFLGIIIAGPLILYSMWACIEWIFKGDGF